MARHARRLTLEYTAESIADLDEIWEWNAERFGVDHANRYIAFLKIQCGKLTTTETPGRPVPTRDRYRYSIIKRRSKGHGHVAVFELAGRVLRLLRYFHTSQDWQSKLAEEVQ